MRDGYYLSYNGGPLEWLGTRTMLTTPRLMGAWVSLRAVKADYDLMRVVLLRDDVEVTRTSLHTAIKLVQEGAA